LPDVKTLVWVAEVAWELLLVLWPIAMLVIVMGTA
jgi:hypothetical protein